MADYGILFLSRLFMYRTDDDGNYVVPERHEPGSVTFTMDELGELTTVSEYVEAYEYMAELEGTGYDTTLFQQFILMILCSSQRLIDGTLENLWTEQCYDNFVADIYLTDAGGPYAVVDLFTWRGIAIAYGYMMVHNGLASIGESFTTYAFIYLFYMINIGNLKFGEIELMTPFYDWFYAPFTIEL